MSNENPGRDVFENIKEGLSDIGSKFGQLMDDVFSGEGETAGDISVHADVYRTAEQFVVELEIPGVSKDQVKIEVIDGGSLLLVKGKKELAEQDEETVYERKERRFGSFRKSFALPVDVELEKIKAKYDNGVLTVTFGLPHDSRQEPDQGEEINID